MSGNLEADARQPYGVRPCRCPNCAENAACLEDRAEIARLRAELATLRSAADAYRRAEVNYAKAICFPDRLNVEQASKRVLETALALGVALRGKA